MAHDLLGSVKSIDHLKLFNQTWFSYRVLFDTFDTEEGASFSSHVRTGSLLSPIINCALYVNRFNAFVKG